MDIKMYWEYNKSLEETIELLNTKAEIELKEAKMYKDNSDQCDIHMANMSYYSQIAQWLQEYKKLKTLPLN